MSELHFCILSYILTISCSEVQFEAWKDSNHVYYPSFVLLGASGSCGLTVSNFQLWQRNSNSWRDWNKEHDEPGGVHRYAWDYGEAFDTPLSVRLIKSNGKQQVFDDIIEWYDQTTTWRTGREFCPTPSPTMITNNPTYQPTDQPTPAPTSNPSPEPTNDPTPSPTVNPTTAPTTNPTKNPTSTPTDNPTPSPTNIPSKHPTNSPITQQPTTLAPTLSPTYIPTLSPSKPPTNDPTISPTTNPSVSPIKTPNTSPTIKSAETPTYFPTVLPTKTTTSTVGIQGNRGETGFILSSNNNPILVTILAIVIGILACCICVLLTCYCSRRQSEKKIEKRMELSRIASTSTVHHIDTALTQPDSPTVVHYQQQQQASFASLPAQPIMPNMNAYYTDAMALRLWLNNCGLPQYYDLFVEHGFDEQMATIITLNDLDLQNMGIGKLSHRKVILNQIDVMKSAQDGQENDGNYEGEVNNTTDVVVDDESDMDEEQAMVTKTEGGEKQKNDSSSCSDNENEDMYITGNGQIPQSPKG